MNVSTMRRRNSASRGSPLQNCFNHATTSPRVYVMAAGDLEPGELGLELAFLRLKFDDVLIYTIDRRRAGRRKEQVSRFVEIAVELCNAGLEGADTLPVKTLFVALDDAIGDILEPFRGQHIRTRLLDDIPLEKIFVLGFLSTSSLTLFRPANIMPVIFTTAPLAAARHERRPRNNHKTPCRTK